MSSGGLDLTLMSALMWVALVILFLGLGLSLYFSNRSTELVLSVSSRGNKPVFRTVLGILLHLAGLLIVALLSLQLTTKLGPTERVGIAAASAAAAFVGFQLVWRILRGWTRQSSDREAYWHQRAEEVWRGLSSSMEERDIVEVTCRSLVDELGLDYCALVTKSHDGYRTEAGFGESVPLIVLPGRFLVAEYLGQSSRPRGLFLGSGDNSRLFRWPEEEGPESQQEMLRLAEAGAKAAVSLRRGGKLGGVYLLGTRSDGEELRAAHLRFAERIVGQCGMVLDAGDRMREQVHRKLTTDRVTHERETLLRARGLLAPPEKPEIPGLNYGWEAWRGSSTGNSMHDVVALPNRCLGLLMAEAGGSNLEAAIQLVQLQALIRSRFWAYAEDLSEMMESTERALNAARTARHPVRVFCGRYNPEDRTLRFVNAGYYAPMILRTREDGAEVQRLTSKSGALCEKGKTELREEEVALLPNDLLALVTPGVVAARNPAGEPWGESRLADTLLGWEAQPASDVARLTLRTVEEYSANDASAPERTLLVLRPVGSDGKVSD